ncbi:MAG TPA: aldehyde dehydrogenase family protein [Euryarchaeota archaeon]|nr:aldehyde dehydrogenase family protein [Euryarchaeota archaeon]
MRFENENTLFRQQTSGNEEQFHSKYEYAMREISQISGRTSLNYIGGYWKRSRDGLFEDRFPGDLTVLNAKFQLSQETETRQAIGAAKKAFDIWRHLSFQDRCDIFDRAVSILSDRKYEMAAIVTMENGKNRYEAMADVDEAIDFMRYYSGQMKLNNGFYQEMPSPFPNEHPRNLLRPYGVWGVVSPFNFPAAIMIGMSTGAMITGNTVVLKPSSDAPWPAFVFADILAEAGMPSGVFNVVTGPGESVGSELVRNDEMAGFVFTGSKDVGVRAMRAFSAARPRPFVAEMGGKNAVIVTSNSDLEEAAVGAGRAAFGFGGQKCSACSRVLVEKGVYKDFLARIIDWTKELHVGDPRERRTFFGPLINEAALKKYRNGIRRARRDGKVLVGGKVISSEELNGYYVEPAIVTGLKPDHPLMRNELFVPILCVMTVPSLKRAIEIANQVEYGLTAGIMSREESEVEYFMDNIAAGTIYANRRAGASTAAMVGAQPFVGWKMSGTTCKAAGGEHYLQQFMREQSQTRCD